MAEREEHEKAWIEIQERFSGQAEALRRVTQQERSTIHSRHKLELVLAELKNLPDTTPTYKQIGRAYFLEPKARILTEGSETVSAAGVEIESLKAKKAALEEKMQETRKELQEMANAR